MTLSASIKHHTPGRLRLQLAEQKLDQADLRNAVQALRNSQGVRRVSGNPVTRTILLEAESEDQLQSALKEVAEARVIHLKPADEKPQEPESLRHAWSQLWDKTDAFLRETSEDRLDLRSGIALGLTALGLGQMTRGHFLPAGMTLVMYAVGMMDQTADMKKKR